jgi:lysophospholipase L1-like esterase
MNSIKVTQLLLKEIFQNFCNTEGEMETKNYSERVFNLFCLVLIVLCIILTTPLGVLAVCDPVTIMPLGNSITDDYGGFNSYREDLYDSLDSAGYVVDFVGSQNSAGLIDPHHEGHGGWHAHQIRDNIIGWLGANHAEIVLLHIGTNDMSTSQTAADCAVEIGQILDNIDTYSSDVWVILARIINRGDGDHSKSTALNEAIQNLADARIDDKIIVVDMESALDYPDDLADTLHPNASGYGKMAAVWYNALNNFLPGYCSDDPVVYNLALTSTSGNNLPTDDLTCGYDLAGSATTAATAWYRDGTELMTLFLPMEGGESNALLDFSGNSVGVTTGDSPTWSPTAGHDGNGAFEFDGNDVLDAGAVFPTLSSYSQAAWVQKTANDDWQNIVSGTNFEHLLLVNNGTLKCGHNELISLEDTETLNNGEWYHVAVTFDYDSGKLILYKNGSPVANKIVATKDMTNAQVFIGRYGGGASWRGVIDDVRIYAHVLSPEQIAAMYNSGSGNNNVTVSQETAAGDTWQCEVIPFSDSDVGATQPSDTLNIIAGGLQPTVGNEIVFDSIITKANRRAMPFTMIEDGTIESISIYHEGGSGNVILAVYDGQTLPDNRLAVTAQTAVQGSAGWQTIPLITPVFVPDGTRIWLAWVFENNPGIRYEGGSPGRAHSSQSWSGGMPDPFGASSQKGYVYSIYATYTTGGGVEDLDPPTPDPMTWASPPAAISPTSIVMTATTATDPSGCEYYFEETSGNPGADDSGWQDSPTYVDTGLEPDLEYSYICRTRDKSPNQNETESSIEQSAITPLEGVQATVGNEIVFDSIVTKANRRAMPFTMIEDGTIESISIYHEGGSGNVILAVYDGQTLPDNRLAVTAQTAVQGSAGWQTIPLITPVFVPDGTRIWLAWVFENNPGIRYEGGSPGRAHSSQSWSGGMPDPFGASSQKGYVYSIYATYTTGPMP